MRLLNIVHHYFFRLCRIYAIIVIKNDFVIHLHSQGPSASVENIGLRPRFSTPPRDLANVNEWKTMFDQYIVVSRLWGAATFSRDFTTNLTPHCRVFSGAVKTEKLNTPLWPGPRGCGYKSQVH